MMSVSFKYWDDCVEPEELKLLWDDKDVSKEWTDANEKMGQKIHLSRDPDGQTYLTQIEMRAVAEIIVQRHCKWHLEPTMICALADILSDRQLLAERYDKKTKETKLGIMQISLPTANWLVREMGYKNYDIEGNPHMLYRPFVNVYFGAAYIKWLSNHDDKERSEEYVVRAYKGGIKNATHKSTVDYFARYLSVKDSLPPKSVPEEIGPDQDQSIRVPMKSGGDDCAYWDSKVSQEDMEDMWKNPYVLKEWTRSSKKHGRVHFLWDDQKRPYLTRVEVKAVAQIIVQRYFSTRGIEAASLAALSEVSSMRYVNGQRSRTGLMGIDFPTAAWLYRDIGCNKYKVQSVDDLFNPFVSMYFGAAYFDWLSEYKERKRSLEFVVQAYFGGPDNVSLQETGHYWLRFEEASTNYEQQKREEGSCCIS